MALTAPKGEVMRITRAFPVNLPINQIDLYRWVTEMTSEDYESYARPAHKAMGSFFRGSRFVMVNVECIGADMIVQHYELIEHSRSSVRLYSARSTAYVYRWFPVTVSVPWEMSLHRSSDRSCELTCTVGIESPSLFIRALAWTNGLGLLFLRRHLALEGAAFARDLERKFAGVETTDEALETRRRLVGRPAS
jgi:hypothetical protein